MADKQTWAEYLKEAGETGWGVPGAGEGLETLWSDYVAPWWSSYDELENPNWSRTKDIAKFIPNTAWDIGKFYADMGIDIGQVGLDRLARTEFYNPFTEEGMRRNTLIPGVDFENTFTKNFWTAADAFQSDKLGTPTLIEDNPYKNKVTREDDEGNLYTDYQNRAWIKMQNKALKEAEDHLYGKNGIVNKKVQDEIASQVDKEFSWSDWAKENRNTDPKVYDDMWDQKYQDKINKRFGKTFQSVYDNSMKGQMAGNYGIMSDDMLSPSFKHFDIWDDYAASGDPLFKYDSPRADLIHKAHIISDLASLKAPFKIGGKIIDAATRNYKRAPKPEGIFRTDVARDFMDRGYRR